MTTAVKQGQEEALNLFTSTQVVIKDALEKLGYPDGPTKDIPRMYTRTLKSWHG